MLQQTAPHPVPRVDREPRCDNQLRVYRDGEVVGQTCGKLLGIALTRPYTIFCSRCKQIVHRE